VKVPARIHAILADHAKWGIVFRRGPSNEVCTLSWNRRTDQFELGQWLSGRIYERRSDLSPDGRYLIYFAANYKTYQVTGGTWTAISRAPWLKALVLYGKGDTWNGGGLFVSKKRFWLNDGPGVHCPHVLLHGYSQLERAGTFAPAVNYGPECLGVYFPRLLRDGWTHGTPKGPDAYWAFEKPITHQWLLRKISHAGEPSEGRGVYWDTHEVENSATGELRRFPDWEWADVDGRDIVYAEKGCLYRQEIRRKEPWSEPRCLIDLNPMEFENREAPY
jgi:hypothetical protein